MKLSFTTMGTPDLDHKGAIELAQQLGFQGVDIRQFHIKGEVTEDTSDEDLRQVGQDFKNAGIAIPGILCYQTIDSKTPPIWENMKRKLSHMLHTADLVGADSVRMFGDYAKEGESIDEFISKAASVLDEVLQHDTTSTVIAIQNHAGSLNTRESVQLAKEVNNPRFGVVFSPDHCIIMKEQGFEELLELVLPWTKEVYIADTIPQKEGKHETVYPGKGQVPLKETIDFFQNNNFQGYYSFKWEKIWKAHLDAPEVVFPKFIEFMHQFNN